jgi:sugar phosphate isomerase/epimerase
MNLGYSINGQVLREWYNDRDHEELFQVIRNNYDGVELYLGDDRDTTKKEESFDIAEEAGIEVLSVHAPKLEDLHKEKGHKEIVGKVNEYFTEYDESGEREKIRNLHQVTMHPSQKKGEKEEEDWANTVYNLALASQTMKEWGHPEAASIENCARYDPPYLITEASDVRALVEEADSNPVLDKVGIPVNMTLDPGHSPAHSYKEMIVIVDSTDKVDFSSVHLHDKISASDSEKREEIRSQFDIPEDWAIGTEDWEGEMDHIPLGTGDVDLSAVGEVVDDETLVTVELHPTYIQRPDAAAYSARVAREELV